MKTNNEATRLVCLEAAQKLRTYVGIYTGDKQARRLIDELSNIASALASSTAPSSGEGADASLWPCGDCGKSVKEACSNRPCGYRAMQQQANHAAHSSAPSEAVAQFQQDCAKVTAALAAPAPTGESLPVQGVPEDVSYELVQDDMVVAGASGPTAEREMRHYAVVYGQDGPVEIFKVTRSHVDLFSPAPTGASK